MRSLIGTAALSFYNSGSQFFLRGGTICSHTLQLVPEQDLSQAAHVFAAQFMDDPLYQLIIPDSSSRLDVLKIFFEHYLEMMYPYSDVWATSNQMEAVALVFYSERFDDTFRARSLYALRIAKAIMTSIPACRYIGLGGFIRGVNILHSMSSAWLGMLGNRAYHHLDMLVVQTNYRRQGYVTRIMNPLLEQCQLDGKLLTLETQNPDNLPIYEHYGFQVVDTLPLKNSPLQQYCMVYDPLQSI